MTKNLEISREGSILILKREDGEKRYFDLKSNTLFKEDKKKGRIFLVRDYKFFQWYSISDITSSETKFHDLIITTSKVFANCTSISTFLTRLNQIIICENYIVEGIRYQLSGDRDRGRYRVKGITKPLEFYNKNTIKLFKSLDIMVDSSIEQRFIDNYEFCTNLFEILYNIDINNEMKKKIIEDVFTSYYPLSHFKSLIKDYSYNPSSLLKYLCNYLYPFENCGITEGLSLLKDYINMASHIGRDVDKYPKYLKSMHDIITANYNANKQTYDEVKFNNLAKTHLEYEGKEFVIQIPKSPKEIIVEGTNLNHCVASYVDKILREETYIFFLRRTKEKDKSLVTLEIINNEITQAKGKYNRFLEENEREFLSDYCKKKEIILKA